MSASLNRVALIGNLGRDPEIRRLNSGDPVCNLSVATNDRWKDKQTGERKERVEFHRVVIFNPHICDVAEKYLRKGSMVYIEGALQTRKWQDQQGQDRYSTEVVVQNFRGDLQMLSWHDDRPGDAAPAATSEPDDEIPF